MTKIITLDGTAASGKGTLAIELAKLLKAEYINTGAIYRLISWLWIKENPNLEFFARYHQEQVIKITSEINVSRIKFNQQEVLLDNQNIWDFIKTENVAKVATKIAKIQEVHNPVNILFRKMANLSELIIVDGRNAGSFIFPQANLKFFIDAEISVRAGRRIEKKLEVSPLPLGGVGGGAEGDRPLPEMVKILQDRDHSDMNREHGKLIRNEDMIFLDTSQQTISESLNFLLEHIQDAGLKTQ